MSNNQKHEVIGKVKLSKEWFQENNVSIEDSIIVSVNDCGSNSTIKESDKVLIDKSQTNLINENKAIFAIIENGQHFLRWIELKHDCLITVEHVNPDSNSIEMLFDKKQFNKMIQVFGKVFLIPDPNPEIVTST